MKIAHFSDLHLLALEGVPLRRFLNKRLTGWANLRLKRSSVHRAGYVRAIAHEIRRLGIDHVVLTGDLTNLALESEYELVRDVLDQDLGMDPSRVTVVPGNHDLYTRGSLSSRRFERYLSPYLESDLPQLAIDTGGGRFPIVKLRGPIALVALSSAVPRPPLVAAGELGQAQIAALARVLAHAEVAGRTVVIALHHPAVHAWTPVKAYVEGLRDSQALLAQLRHLTRGLVLHGHLHRRIQRSISQNGSVLQVGATSASLHHVEPDRMAGFNVYEISEAAPPRIEAHVYVPAIALAHAPESGAFHLDSVPKHV